MEKKEKRIFRDKRIEAQYKPLLDDCQKAIESQQSLVNNINIIYNLNNLYIPDWKYLNTVQKIGLFFEFIVDENWQALTLRFSFEFIDKSKDRARVADFVRRRINQNFKNRLGFVPEYLFTLEFGGGLFHIHGVINPYDKIKEIKRILKTTAFGRFYTRNPLPENKKIVCEPIYDKMGWACYILKTSKKTGFDVYVCNDITRKMKSIYSGVQKGLKRLKLKKKQWKS